MLSETSPSLGSEDTPITRFERAGSGSLPWPSPAGFPRNAQLLSQPPIRGLAEQHRSREAGAFLEPIMGKGSHGATGGAMTS